VTTWNRESELLFGLHELEALGRDFFSLDLAFSVRELEEPFYAIVHGSAHLENRNIHSSHPKVDGLRCKVRMRSLLAPNGVVCGVTLIVEDLALQRAARPQRSSLRHAQKVGRGGSKR
jgi:hypothetical protein